MLPLYSDVMLNPPQVKHHNDLIQRANSYADPETAGKEHMVTTDLS